MSRKSRKQAIKWFKRLLKYGLFFYVCYCVAEFYIRKEQSAASAAIHQADEKACQNKLASMKQVPILGGAYVDKTMYSSQISDLICALIIYLCGFTLFLKYFLQQVQG